MTIPKEIPSVVTDKIYMITKSDDTITYDFGVQVPAPVVSRISCEYAHDGDRAVLYGDYFIDDRNVPLTITMAGNVPVSEIICIEKTKVSFRIPQGSQRGYLNVKSIYGTGRSKFQFRDDRGMILLFFGLRSNDLALIFVLQVLISICAGSIFPLLWSMYADCADLQQRLSPHFIHGAFS
ncbi:MAG: hypothetical protein PHS71_02640 [Proteiniphilum sp.]|nr:hypothetical protein [Proteiniphilum sp.]